MNRPALSSLSSRALQAPVSLSLIWGALPWAAVGIGLYGFRSALLAFLFYHGLCFVGGLLLRADAPPAVERRFSRDAFLFFGIGLAINLGAFLLYRLTGTFLVDRKLALDFLSGVSLPPSSYIWMFPYFALINPLAEEFYWRGGVYLRLRGTGLSWERAALLSSALFAAWHWLVLRMFLSPGVALFGTFVIACAGFLLTLVYERTRRLVYCIALHAFAADAPLLLILYLMGRE